jgi:hypothetical protein
MALFGCPLVPRMQDHGRVRVRRLQVERCGLELQKLTQNDVLTTISRHLTS